MGRWGDRGIDGGAGQLSAALGIMRELGVRNRTEAAVLLQSWLANNEG